MKKLRIYMIFFLLISCFEKRENEVNVNNIDDRIRIGMTKEDLKKEIGVPADSTMMENNKNKVSIYMYYTNDFSDYRLRVFFDENDKIKTYRID